MIAPARSIKREEDRLRQIAAANGDRIVKSRIDGSYQLVDAATNTLIWPTHVRKTQIGATFNELRERITGVTYWMSARKKKEKGESGYLPTGSFTSTYVTIEPVFDGKSWKLIPVECGKGNPTGEMLNGQLCREVSSSATYGGSIIPGQPPEVKQ